MTIEISTDQNRLDVTMIHSFLANESYWVPGITRAGLEKCIKHSLCFGAYLDGRQIGFARAVTDFFRYAHLLDVFVLPEFRGRGLGTDVVRVLCRYGFAIRGLHRLQAETLADNVAMIAAAGRAGFRREGTLRRSAWVNGDFADEVILGLLAPEWEDS